MLKGLSKTWLLITFLAILITGALSTMHLIRDYNIQSDIFGTPTKEKTSYKIDDFNFQVNYLLFSETGNEDEYISTATTLPITNFDKTKKYTLIVNESLCNRTNGSYEYVQATFNNNFKDLQNNILFKGKMQISIVPYKDYTKLTFIINGKESTDYWSQYLVNYGLKITIIEFDYSSSLQADNVALIKYYVNEELYRIDACELNIEHDLYTYEIEDEYLFFGWFTEIPQGNLKELTNITSITTNEYKEINLYAKYFHKNDRVEGYNDCQLDLIVELDNTLNANSVYGSILLSYFDEEDGYTKQYTAILKNGTNSFKGLKYVEFTLTIKTTLNVQEIEPIVINVNGHIQKTINLRCNETNGYYNVTVI